LVDLHQLVAAARGTGPRTPLGPSDDHRGVRTLGGRRRRGRTHWDSQWVLVKVSVSTRYAMSLALAGALIYGVIGAVTLGWYWGVFFVLWALVLGATFSVVKAFRRRKHP